MKGWSFIAILLVSCGGTPGSSGEVRHEMDSLEPRSLTTLQTFAEPSHPAREDALPVTTRVSNGMLAVEIEVGDATTCAFGQSDGPSVRDIEVSRSILSIDVGDDDANAWLFGGGAIACEGGREPLYAWSLLEPRITGPKLDELELDDVADPMAAGDDDVVRLRSASYNEIRSASIWLGGRSFPARIETTGGYDGEPERWHATFDVAPETWVHASLAHERATLNARIDVRFGEGEHETRDISETLDVSLRAIVTDAAHTPLDDG